MYKDKSKEQKEQYEIRFSGSGGQGLILAGIILAEAANLQDRFVIQTQSYGPEARGGSCKAEVIISNKAINYLAVEEADLFLALNEESYLKYYHLVKPAGLIIVDEGVVPKNYHTIAFPITRAAKEILGNGIVANIIGLGILASLSLNLEYTSFEKALKARVPLHTIALNLKALQKGWELGSSHLETQEVKPKYRRGERAGGRGIE